MNFGRVESSPRLQRALALLRSRGSLGATTQDFIDHAHVCAVNSIASELRANGFHIDCKYVGMTTAGGRIYRYWLVEPKAGQGELFGRTA